MARIVENRIAASRTRVRAGEPVRITGRVLVDEPVEGEIAGTLYVNGSPVKEFSARISGREAGYALELVLGEPGVYRVRTYAELRWLPLRAVVNVPGRLDGVVVVDSSAGEQLVFGPGGEVSRRKGIGIVYTVVGYPVDRRLCSRLRAWLDERLVYDGTVCATPSTRATVTIPVERAARLRVVAEPLEEGAARDEIVLRVVDVAGITGSAEPVDDTGIRVRITGLPRIGDGYWYRVEAELITEDTVYVLGFTDTAGSDTGEAELVIKRYPSQGCVCINAIEIRLCSKNWTYPCIAVVKTIRLPRDICIGPLCGR